MEECKAPEQELRQLIEESRLVLSKLKKTLNGLLYVGVPIFIAFLGSAYFNNNRMTKMESTRMTDEQLQEKFATRQQVISYQNDVFDLNNYSFQKSKWAQSDMIEKRYSQASKEFLGDATRSVAD